MGTGEAEEGEYRVQGLGIEGRKEGFPTDCLHVAGCSFYRSLEPCSSPTAVAQVTGSILH